MGKKYMIVECRDGKVLYRNGILSQQRLWPGQEDQYKSMDRASFNGYKRELTEELQDLKSRLVFGSGN